MEFAFCVVNWFAADISALARECLPDIEYAAHVAVFGDIDQRPRRSPLLPNSRKDAGPARISAV